MANDIVHTAVITAIGSGSVTVKIDPVDNCAGCHIASVCGKSGENGESLTVPVDNIHGLIVGDRVRVTATDKSALLAAIIGLGIPCLLLLTALLTLLACGVGTLLSVIITFIIIAIYYIISSRHRQSIENGLRWSITKI